MWTRKLWVNWKTARIRKVYNYEKVGNSKMKLKYKMLNRG